MRVYQCDSCKKTVTDPYEAKMKEFYVGTSYFDNGMSFPVKSKRKTKVHLCDDCYKGLQLITKKMERENNG